MYRTVRLNFGGGVREVRFLGEDYLVADAVAIQESVLTGMDGVPVLYADKHLNEAAPSLHHMPIVVYHPDPAGPHQGLALDPDILNAQEVGLVLNPVHEGGKTAVSLYFNRRRLEEVDERVLDALLEGKGLEGSAGLSSVDLQTEGDFNGTHYNAEVTKIKYDHFAVLPDQQGACSLAAGCGVQPRLNAAPCKCEGKCDDCKGDHKIEHYLKRYPEEKRKAMAKTGLALPDGSFPVETEEDLLDAVHAHSRARNRTAAKRHIVKRAEALGKTAVLPEGWGRTVKLNKARLNETSLSEIEMAVRSALREKFQKPGYSWNGYVHDVYEDYVVYCVMDYSTYDEELYKIGYRMEDGKAVLIGQPEEVKREVSYVSLNGAPVGEATGVVLSKRGLMIMTKTEKVTKLLTSGGFEEADRPYLEGKTEAQLDKLLASQPAPAPAPAPAATHQNTTTPTPAPQPETDPFKYVNSLPAPPAVKTLLLSGIQAVTERHAAAVKLLMDHPNNKFDKEFLEKKELRELEGMVALLGPSATHQNGDGGGRMFKDDYFGAQGTQTRLNATSTPTATLGLPSEAEFDKANKS